MNFKKLTVEQELDCRKLGAIDLKPNKNEYYCFEKLVKIHQITLKRNN